MTRKTQWIVAYVLMTLGVVVAIRTARGDELDVRATLTKVNEILKTDVRDVPAVFVVDSLPHHRWGAYAESEIRLSAEILPGCEAWTLAHEVSHHVAIKARLLAGIPPDVDLLKDELERIAIVVEDAWPVYTPNCRRRIDR